MAVFSTESVTNWWPHTSSSNACLVSREPGRRASAQSTANGFGARVTAFPLRSRRAFGLVQFECVEAHAYRIQGSRVFALCVGDCVRRAERNDIRNIHL